MTPDLHLILELDTWMAQEGISEPLIKLATFLGAHGNITLTLVSRDPLRPGLERLATAGDQGFPDHFIADGGLALYHARQNGTWAEDVGYRRWVRLRWDPLALERVVAARGSGQFRQVLGSSSPRRAVFTVDPGQSLREAAEELKVCLALTPFEGRILLAGDHLEVVPWSVGPGTAASYLHEHLAGSRLLMACGSSEEFLDVLQLAEIPVLLAGGALTISSSALAMEKVYFSPEAGPNGVLDALMGLDHGHRYAGAPGG